MQILGLNLVRCGGYVLVAVMFLMFVHFNNGMVVGDRSAHVVTLHLSQLGYFVAFFTLLTVCYQEHSRILVIARQNVAKMVILLSLFTTTLGPTYTSRLITDITFTSGGGT